MQKTEPCLSRRSFLKTTGVLAGAATCSGFGANTLHALAAVETTGVEGEEEIFMGACRCNCVGGCFVNIHVRDGKVVRTSMRELPEPQYNRICSKGLTHMYRIYGEKRAKYPLKRVGERGSLDSFERISWDEALSIIVEKWNAIFEEHGKSAVALYWGSGNYGTTNGCRTNDIWNRFHNVVGLSLINRSVDIAAFHGLWDTIGRGKYQCANEPLDMLNSKTIINWGSNPAISSPQIMHFVMEAKQAGATFIVIDPVYNVMSSKADIYVPVRAGTDGALALCMCKLMIDKGWANLEFIRDHTMAPYLVKDSNGKFLKQSDLGIEIAEGAKDMPVVRDADGNIGTEKEISEPVIEGSFKVMDYSVKTAYSLVLEGIEKYDLQSTSEITGIPAEQIEQITDIYCNNGPANILSIFGLNHYYNGHWTYFCQALLPMISGQIGMPGAGIGIGLNSGYPGSPKNGKPEGFLGTPLNVTNLKMDEIMETGMFGDKPAVIKSVMFVGCNAMTNGVERNNTINWINKLDFVVVVEQNLNDNALWADIILPAAHWFEEEDVFTLATTQPFMLYQEQAVDPLWESKADFDIVCELGTALGYGKYFQITPSDFIEEFFNTETAKNLGISYSRLKSEGALKISGEKTYVFGENDSFPGRMRMYNESPAPEYNWGQEIDLKKEHIPYWEYPYEVRPDSELIEKYPFHMLSDHSRYHTHSQWWDVDILIELVGGEPFLRINPYDAEEYGIENGDLVRVYNDRGYCVMHAYHNPGLRRGTLSAPKGWDASQQIDGHFASLTSKTVNPACTNAAFNDVVVAIEKL